MPTILIIIIKEGRKDYGDLLINNTFDSRGEAPLG